LGLAVALVAERLLARPATDRHSNGLQRAEVLGALANGVLLLAATVWITVEAIRRLGHLGHIDGPGVAALGLLGLVVNLASALALGRVAGSSLNLRGAWLHLMADAAGSVLALIAGVAVWVWDARAVDPIVSLLLAAIVVVLAVRLVRDATHVLLEGVPAGLDSTEVADVLRADPSVLDVHHVHVWALASDAHALSAHVVLEGDPSLHEAQELGDALRAVVAERFGIDHTTLELECHACDAPDDDPDQRVSRGVSRGTH
jgi:cobalt-zinc-cadmium efflux system protein